MSRHIATIAVVAAVFVAGGTAASSFAAARTPHRTAPDTGYVVAATDSAAGQYLTIVGGCNDCHTPDWNAGDGRTAEADRLTGNPVGYRGPWGTSYAANLRVLPPRMTEDRWVQVLTTADGGHGDPPMPWMNTRMMSQRDLRNLYRYVKSLGPKGERAPRMVPPDSTPKTPFILMVPQQPGSGIKVTKDKP
jgi:hypothetical protein